MHDQKVFCPAPWNSRIIDKEKAETCCCWYGGVSIDDIKNHISKGQRDPGCEYCWQREDRGQQSPRRDYINRDGIFDSSGVEHITIDLGNVCNAECIMCSGNASSKRNSWVKKYKPEEFIINVKPEINSDIDFTKYPDLKSIYFLGGEPFLNSGTISILKKLKELNVSKNLTISLVTNSSTYDENIIELLTDFKHVMITLSLDGGGKHFEYQRRPLKWNSVMDIAIKLSEISDTIIINYVVSAVSLWGFNDFISWLENIPQSVKLKKPNIILTHVSSDSLSLHSVTDEKRDQWMNQATDHELKKEIILMLNDYPFDPIQLDKLKADLLLEDKTSDTKHTELNLY